MQTGINMYESAVENLNVWTKIRFYIPAGINMCGFVVHNQ
jgi:hypothetical protein